MAEIVPFPARPEDRLRAALRGLEAALAEQQEALAGFRANLGELKDAVGGLHGSVAEYRDTLARTAEDIEGAHKAARRLERTADIWLRS